jgi:DNA polymerase III epsilon subunit-like protein
MAREMFPGKSNSLDALCKRLEVDNSRTRLHGALLDAGLLAEVYIRMTRGQDSLVIDAEPRAAAGPAARPRSTCRGLRAAGAARQRRGTAAHEAAGRPRQGQRRQDRLAAA